MPATKIAALGLSLLLAGSLAACGGDDEGDDGGGDGGGSGETVSASAWAADVCGAMKGWVDGIQAKTTEMAESFTSGSPEEGKEVLLGLFEEMSAQTGDLISAVEEAGVPDVEGGEQVSEDFVTAFTEAQDILDSAQGDIQALPSDPQGFQQGASELGPRLQEAISSIGESISEPESQELRDAVEQEEACAAVPG
jgi:hypothetical protein